MLHLWQADLAAPHPAWPADESTLSAEEKARQARLRTPALCETYARAHGFVRAVLSHYTGQPASALAFEAEPNGKPTLPGSGLHFNLSYRPGRALLALSNAGPVGVDVEFVRPLPDAAALVQELFSPAEQAALRAAAPANYWPLFFTIWTRKEAYAKMLGQGVNMPFSTFAVLDFAAGTAPELCAPAGVWLHSLPLTDGTFLGAVATHYPAPPLQLRTYSPNPIHNL